MREKQIQRVTWTLIAVYLSICDIRCEPETWSKPEQNAKQDNGWVPVQGTCLTCRANRDLDTQSTNEQIGKVLSPPLQRSPSLAPLPPPSPQYVMNKQPRILPFASFHQFNSPYPNQLHPTKLFSQEGQKQFYQFEGSHFPAAKQPFALSAQQQQLIPQSPSQQSSVPQQRFPVSEPYPFTLPIKMGEPTTPKATYQPKIRFPDSESTKIAPNKIASQNNEEIQLLYVPVETLQRGRKNMKELLNQNQFQHAIPHGFVSPQYNLQYPAPPAPPPQQHSPISKQPDNSFYFPGSNFSPAPNFIQFNPIASHKLPETVFANISKNFLQPYFTINGLYSPPLPQQIQPQPLPSKQPELQYYLQPTLLGGAGLIKNTEPLRTNVLPPADQRRQPNKYVGFNTNPQNIQNEFLLQNNPTAYPELIKNVQSTVTNFAGDAYSATTPDVSRTTQYVTEKSTVRQDASKYSDFSYQYETTRPQQILQQTQQQQYTTEHHIPQPAQPQYNTIGQADSTHQKQIFQNSPVSHQPTATSAAAQAQSAFEEQPNPSYPVPHQPPLSFYMEKLQNTKVNDVLYLLKDSKTIPVLDTLENEPPQVFVGPSELQPPKGYIKFELPYLSSLDYNRIERMIDRLPFFVAPLNFKPPPGYSKIPFPAPHIGSVVLSNSTIIEESVRGGGGGGNDEKYDDQKYKPSTEQTFSASPALSTITPQLTSQINSLLETPSSAPVEQAPFKTYNELSTEKPFIHQHAHRPVVTSTAEPPKRNVNRQRKPIYRGYPTTTETLTAYKPTAVEDQQLNSNNERVRFESNKDADNYVEFSTKAKFNLNNGVDNVLQQNPTPKVENAYQSQQQISSTFRPMQNNIYELANYFTNLDNDQNVNAKPHVENQVAPIQGENSFLTYQNYPVYHFDNAVVSSQSPANEQEPAINQIPNSVENQSNRFNFNNVKPLSQYNPFVKNDQEPLVNATAETSAASHSTARNEDSYQFWNQNQFFKSNPTTLEYFSSTTDYPQSSTPETTVATSEQNFFPNRFTKSTTTAGPEPTFVTAESPSSSTEPTEKVTLSTYRPRGKQRLHLNRYQTNKFTTEKQIDENKENVDHSYKIPPSERYNNNRPVYEQNHETFAKTQSDSVLLQSDDNSEPPPSRTEIKHRRRRPIKSTQATIVTPVTEISSSTSRSYRTRATRYPTPTTERYRVRRPTTTTTTNSASTSDNLTSDWSSYNFAPSAPASNEITGSADKNKPATVRAGNEDASKDDKNVRELDNYWSEAVSIHQSQSYEVSPSTRESFSIKNLTEEHNTEVLPWNDAQSKHNAATDVFSRYTPTVESYIRQYSIDENEKSSTENKTENLLEKKDPNARFEIKNTSKTKNFEETNSTFTPVDSKDSSNDESISISDGKTYNQELKKDGQKKAYDPEDEKKPGRRRGTWVRKIRIKRPQDVFETAESQNLGRINDNSLPVSNSKTSKINNKEEESNYKVNLSSITEEEIVPLTETIPEQIINRNVTTEKDDYAIQNNFAQMLSDFLNSNEKSAPSANNIERYNISTENSISFILGLENNEHKEKNSSFNSNYEIVNSTEIIVPSTDEIITTTINPSFDVELTELHTTTDELQETTLQNKFIGTSTTTEISLETEICYRGKCVKTKKSKASDLLPVE